MRLGVQAALVDGERVPGDVEIDPDSGTIRAIGSGGGGGRGIAVPGLVDLQVNGFAGVEFRSCDAGDYRVAAAALAARGVTAVQPTFFSQSTQDYERGLRVLDEVRKRPPRGCTFLAAHLEGPFLSPVWNGAHEVEFLLDPDPTLADRLLAAGPVGFVTLAPELPGGIELVRHLVTRGVVVSIGHSDATAEQTREAILAGARHLTHCWNAHRRLSSRDPGPAGVALAGVGLAGVGLDGVGLGGVGGDGVGLVVGLVGDLVHVAAEIVAMTMRSAAGRVAVTTDAIAGAGATAGEWDEHGRRVRVVDGVARLDDGTIAGGIAGPDDCLRNLIGLGVPVADAVRSCGGVQRRLLGLAEVLVRPGDPADLAVFDEDWRPLRTLVGGHEVWVE